MRHQTQPNHHSNHLHNPQNHHLHLQQPQLQQQQMTSFGDFRKRITAATKNRNCTQSQLLVSKIFQQKDEDLMKLNKDQNTFSQRKDVFNSSVRIGNSSARSINLRKKQVGYKKNVDLNLSDYLRLYSLSKKAETNKRKQQAKSQGKLLRYTSLQTVKNKSAIDTDTGIKVVRQQIKKQIMTTGKRLKNFLASLDNNPHLKSDQQSLVFMCNVLHIFEDKLGQSFKYAQQLIDDRKKQKKIQDFKQYSKQSGSLIRKNSKLGNSKEKSSSRVSNNRTNVNFSQSVMSPKNMRRQQMEQTPQQQQLLVPFNFMRNVSQS